LPFVVNLLKEIHRLTETISLSRGSLSFTPKVYLRCKPDVEVAFTRASLTESSTFLPTSDLASNLSLTPHFRGKWKRLQVSYHPHRQKFSC